MLIRIIAWDDYNGKVGGAIIGTVIPSFGNPAPRHGWKLIYVYED